MMPARKDLPSTLQRSPEKAQRTWAKTHDSAVETYGEGERSHRTAFASLKHSFEKVGDRWEPKGRKGPSDPQAERGQARNTVPTAGGVDANAPKAHLMEVAQKLDIRGRGRMSKAELVDAIQKTNKRSTARARSATKASAGSSSGGSGGGSGSSGSGSSGSSGSGSSGSGGGRSGGGSGGSGRSGGGSGGGRSGGRSGIRLGGKRSR